jgi:dolichyl-diphosphooligosaccharide--protein glycosyltransferase/undecaprenyl-diphosphooligosaccharide--protein glycosyltransferase
MEKIKEILDLKENRLDIKYFLLLVIIAFIFSLSVRYIWVDTFNGMEAFKWNNELMINTNDGYFYAEGARDILNGGHQENDMSPINSPLSKFTAMLASLIPVSFETLILWMPGVFGSLLVIPIMLIGRIYKQDILGFSAALLASIAWSYYNRTMIGYYDTDLFVVVLPTLMIWGVLYALNSEDSDAFIFAPLFAIATMYWHGGTGHIVNGVFIMILLYTFIFERKNLYYYKFLAIFVIVLTSLSILMKFMMILLLISAFHILRDKLTDKMVIGIVILSAIVYLVFGGISWILGVLNSAYVTRLLVASEIDINSLKFFGVVNTVREAGHIPFEMFANRISGHVITFCLSVVGYILLIFRYRLLILSLPMVVLGFFALQGGLRFTVFAVPFMALGVMYLIFIISKYLEMIFTDKIKPFSKYIFVSLCTIGVLYPNIKHVQEYKVPVVFQKDEINVLNSLNKMATREDYVISWWDYGYPIRYYSNVKTIIDGAKHSGNVNFPVAYSLTNNQVAGANMARLDVEFTEKSFNEKCGVSIECILKAYNIKNPNNFLNALNNKNIGRPPKTRDVYFYLPNRMLDIFPTVDMFSNIDLITGQSKARPFFYISKNFNDNGKVINLGNNIALHKEGAFLQLGKQKIALNYFVITEYSKDGKLIKQVQQANKSAKISVIYMKNYNQFLVMDNRMFNSTFIQLFALENYDKDLFEPVILTPLAKVYKLKI